MKSHYRAVVIGGGIVGVSVLYHLARAGWSDVALIERAELTAGSTWHAAAGFHAFNADGGVAALQSYTIGLYPEIERESGQSCGLHATGGLSLAATPERWQALKAEWARLQSLDHPCRLVTRDEIAALCPIVNLRDVLGGLYDPLEGHCDPHGTTHAFAHAARRRGAEVILRNRVTDLAQTPKGAWRIGTEQGPVVAEHVVNAAGLWTRRVGRMAGVELPVVPMQHHYLVTEEVPAIAALVTEMPAVTDLEGFTYLRQENDGVLLGVYERNPRHWEVDGAPWDYGMDLIPDDLERIEGELAIGLERFPPLKQVGIRRTVNGALTFTPDGNPLVGPVYGLANYWVACGCMAGFSQHGAMALALANWMTCGDPGHDVFGMDVARYDRFASNDACLRATTAQFYARRFVMAYPNESLPAGRPLKTSPAYDCLAEAGARFTVINGLETPSFFAPGRPDFTEVPALRRSNAHDFVAAEVRATREAAGLFDTAVYARFEITGPRAEAWLDGLLACRIPAPGRVRLAPMLNPAGKLVGDLTVSRLDGQTFWLVGSYAMQGWHERWFRERLPAAGVLLRNISDEWMGFSLSGPASRKVLAKLTSADVSNAGLPFLRCGRMAVGLTDAVVARLSLTGELGFEISVPAIQQRTLYRALLDAGMELGLTPIGLRAIDSLRLEKGYGVWSADYTQAETPASSGLDRFVDIDKTAFMGRDAALADRARPPGHRLVLLDIDATDADAHGFEPVWQGVHKVGHVTSGGFGHWVGRSLALATVDTSRILADAPLTVHVVGEERPARLLAEPPYDPQGLRLRS